MTDSTHISPNYSSNYWADYWNSFWRSDSDRLLLAPMEGVVDPVIRELFTEIGGIDLCVTEFIRVTDRVLPKTEFYKYCPELLTQGKTKSGVPVIVQLLGGQPGPLADNAGLAASLGAPGIDLNFGCPAKTVNRHDGGATLLKNPERIHSILQAVRAAVPSHIPVSAKVRLGFSDKSMHVEIAQAAQEGGAAWLTVHARTRDEGYRPPAHWEYIARMREAVSMTVIANGEIWTIDDYHLARQVSGCRHVMIGRGLMAFPDFGRVIKGTHSPLQWRDWIPRVHQFAQMSLTHRHEGYAVSRLKQWTKSLSRQYPEAVAIFDEIKRFESLQPMLERVT